MVWWCPSGSPSVRLVSVHPFSALFSYMLWHIELKFCTWLCFNVLQIKFECHYFASIFEGVMPLCELRIWEIHSFPHFSPTCFDILSWNFFFFYLFIFFFIFFFFICTYLILHTSMYIMISVHFYIYIKTETLDKDTLSLSLSHIMRAHDNCMMLSSYFRCKYDIW